MSTSAPLVPSVLVVHGALGSARQMEPVVRALELQQQFASVHSVELPGHGDTTLAPDATFGMVTFARAIEQCVVDAQLTRPIVFGYSMGGYASLLLEHLAPGTLGGIVTLGTMFRWTPEVAERAAARLNADMIRTKVPTFADTLGVRHASCGGWELVLERTATLLRALGDQPPLTLDVLSTIKCPVHLLVGDRDDSVTFDDTVQAAARLPRGRAALLPDTPHPIEKVAHDSIARAMTDMASHLSAGV